MIPGGYILKARKTLESDLMDKPPLWSKLWDWMLLRAEWREGGKLPRGSFLTSIDEMREAMSWLVGYRRVTPTKDEVRGAYEGFAKAAMVTTAKTTRGMIISITNYGLYQNPKSYEAHSEGHDEGDTKPTVTPQDSKEYLRIKNQLSPGTPEAGPPGDIAVEPGEAVLEPKTPRGKPLAKDPRPSGCPPEAWDEHLKISRGYHRAREAQLGRQAPSTESKIVAGAVALDRIIRTMGYPQNEVLALLGWASEDPFWRTNLRSIGALLKKSNSNGELKLSNVLAAMTADLERKRTPEAVNG